MRRQATTILRYALIVTLSLAAVLSANARVPSHNSVDLAKIVAQHQSVVEDHGHAHEDLVDVAHAYHGHAHNAADHDHNFAYLPPRRGTGFIDAIGLDWPMTQIAVLDRRAFDLDRPPRG